MPTKRCVAANMIAAVVVIGGLGANSSAIANETHPADQSEDESGALGEIVVTARKRSESLENVPAAITVVNAESLLQTNELNLQDYYTRVPGLSIVDLGQDGSVSISLRGLTTGTNGNPTVGITIDDVPIGATNAALTTGSAFVPELDPAELQRIEVLKGPQGTLYGASSIGGVLRYVTAPPDLESSSGRVEVDGSVIPGGDGGYGIRGSVNIPVIADTLAIRASAFDRHDPAYVDDPTYGEKNVNGIDVYGGRVDGLWNITPQFSARLSALIQSAEGSGDSTVDTNPQYQPISGDLNQNRIPGTGAYSSEYQLYTSTLNFKSSYFDITNIAAYSGFNETSDDDLTNAIGPAAEATFGVAGASVYLLQKNSKFSEEFRLSSPTGTKLEWQIGAFYTSENNAPTLGQFRALDPQTGATAGLLLYYPFAAHYHEYAGFADLTYHFTDRFDVQLGGRESHNWQKYTQSPSGPLVGPSYFLSVTSDDNSFTYLITPSLRLSDSVMVYARIASGYQPGGPNTPPAPAVTVPATFGPSTTVNYELGVKGRFFDRHVSLDAAVFYIDWSKIQLAALTPEGFGYTFNGGKAKSQGVEVSAEWQPVDALTLSAEFAYIDAALTNNAGEGFPGVAGDSLPFSSKYSTSISADERFRVSGSVKAFAGLTASYVGQRYEGFPPTLGQPQPLIPAYAYGNVHGGIVTGGFTVTAFLKNVTNKQGVLYSTLIPNANGSVRTSIITPRTLGISVSKAF